MPHNFDHLEFPLRRSSCAEWHYYIYYFIVDKVLHGKTALCGNHWQNGPLVKRACAYAFRRIFFNFAHEMTTLSSLKKEPHKRMNGKAKMKEWKERHKQRKAGLTNSAKKMISFYDVIMWNKYRKKDK